MRKRFHPIGAMLAQWLNCRAVPTLDWEQLARASMHPLAIA
jgi:hypothetical protein